MVRMQLAADIMRPNHVCLGSLLMLAFSFSLLLLLVLLLAAELAVKASRCGHCGQQQTPHIPTCIRHLPGPGVNCQVPVQELQGCKADTQI
jgi:hypothetical protein